MTWAGGISDSLNYRAAAKAGKWKVKIHGEIVANPLGQKPSNRILIADGLEKAFPLGYIECG
jgi:hypothetical protein